MAAQETYRIVEFTKLILREKSDRGQYKDVAAVGDQSARLLDLLYKDAKRGFQYDYIEVNRYDLYLTPADLYDAEDGRFIAEFKRRDDAEKARDALNAAQDETTLDGRPARFVRARVNGVTYKHGYISDGLSPAEIAAKDAETKAALIADINAAIPSKIRAGSITFQQPQI